MSSVLTNVKTCQNLSTSHTKMFFYRDVSPAQRLGGLNAFGPAAAFTGDFTCRRSAWGFRRSTNMYELVLGSDSLWLHFMFGSALALLSISFHCSRILTLVAFALCIWASELIGTWLAAFRSGLRLHFMVLILVSPCGSWAVWLGICTLVCLHWEVIRFAAFWSGAWLQIAV